MEFYSSILTRAGAELITRAQLGQSEIAFTRVATGCGDYADLTPDALQDELERQAGLKQERHSFGLADKETVNQATLKLSWVMDNSRDIDGRAIEQGYFVTEIGIYAKDVKRPAAGEVLYGIAIAMPGRADWIPAYNDLLPATITFDLYVEVANAAEVTITAGAHTYALAEDVWELRSKFENLEASQLIKANATLPWQSWKSVSGGFESTYEADWIGSDMVAEIYVLPESAETAFTAGFAVLSECVEGALIIRSVFKPDADVKILALFARPSQKKSRISYGEFAVPVSAWTADLGGAHARLAADWISGDMIPDVCIPQSCAQAMADCYMTVATEDGALLLSADRIPAGPVTLSVLFRRPSDAMCWADPVAAAMPATPSTLGVVKIGSGVNIAPDGTISVDPGSEGGVVATDAQVRDLIDNIYK